MMQRLVSLFLLLTSSCMVVDAVKRNQLKPDADVAFEALRKDADNLKLFWESLERNVNDHVENKLGTSVSTVPPTASGCTKEKHLESSTASGCTKEKHLESSTASGCTKEKHLEGSTTSGYPTEIHSTTAGYSEEKSSAVESTMKSSPDGYATAAPSLSVPPRDPMQVGSISGIPGINYPDYIDIPITTFTCTDKSYLPGFYADVEAGCQVFHVCWPNRRESFLCPLGTTFNQAILACDYWYSTNCSLAPHYYNINAENSQNSESSQLRNISLSSMINDLLEKNVVDSSIASTAASTNVLTTPDSALSFISKFLPVKAKVTIYPETTGKRAKVVVSSSIGHDKERKIVLRSSEKTRLSPKPLHSHSTMSAPKPNSTPEMPTDDRKHRFEAYDIATKIVADRFAEFLGHVEKITKESRMEEGKSPYDSQTRKNLLEVIPGNFKEFDLATKRLFDSMSEKLEQFLQNSSKHADVQKPPVNERHVSTPTPSEPVNERHVSTPKPSEPVNEKHTTSPKPTESVKVKKTYFLTQLNPRFIVKAVKIPKKEVDQEKSTPHPTKSSPKRQIPTVRVVNIRYPHKISFKPVSYSGKNISPETKKALIENYVRLLKVKSG